MRLETEKQEAAQILTFLGLVSQNKNCAQFVRHSPTSVETVYRTRVAISQSNTRPIPFSPYHDPCKPLVRVVGSA